MATNGSSMRCADGSLGRHRHVCAFFNDLDEEHRVLRSFFKDGFDQGEKATHIVEADRREDYLKRLAEAGINVQEMMGAGQLEVLPWTDMYVRDHRFDQDAMLASVEELIQSGASAGYPRTRLVGHHMDWLFLDQPAVNNLVEYEARLNHVLSVQIQRKRGDGHHADAPARHYWRAAAGESVLRFTGRTPARDTGASVACVASD
jgi:hypothetical protein